MNNNHSSPPYRTSRPPEFPRRRFPPSPRPRDIPVNRRSPPSPSSRFTVSLHRDGSSAPIPDVDALLAQSNSPRPDSLRLYTSGNLAASLVFRAWPDARDAVLRLWRSRLSGAHSLTPRPHSSAASPSDLRDLEDLLRRLFDEHVKTLISGDLVRTWDEARHRISAEMESVSALLRKHMDLDSFAELSDKKKGLFRQRESVERRVAEFRSAMHCFTGYLEGRSLPEFAEDGLVLIRFNGTCNWSLLHSLISRECRRLEDGLPIYAHRQEILHQINNQQVTVLIGETGSGKSTQLVQYLVDSEIASEGAIVCTQPRKIAASSLSERVKEEGRGCYTDHSVTCYPTFSSHLQWDSKVIYTTDHCLLQYYMSDMNLSRISCIIVDEAHERSLNTDLLLALIRTLLCKRPSLRLVIMSATINANQFSDYFFGCGKFHVMGRNFPVDIRYVPSNTEGSSSLGSSSYVSDVVRMASDIHRTEKEGAILAFLTSQNEVEWACENFNSPNAVALPLHGKLSGDEQFQVFREFPGKRKVIFATNIAETSLTIPGVKFVIDSGMVKDSKYDPSSGINVLKVCRISKSSANQRAGRAGRTEPGRCYRLYSEFDFELMPPNQEPEIRKVHLGIAILRIFALGIANVQEFDFIDAPSAEAIEAAVRNLVQLRAVTQKDGVFKLTEEGLCMVKMGIEPRLGKLILGCFNHRLGREGVVLAAVMANASSIFFRVGTDDEKLKSDGLKVKFCHQNGDLFTLLSVYKEWEAVNRDKKSSWCLENSINAKTMRRCHNTVVELESCLERELTLIVPSYWLWNPSRSTECDTSLKKVMLTSLSENVAMYTGNDQLGYEVALSGQNVRLHPSCSLLIYSKKPCWVVFAELLSITHQYLVCVTSFDFDFLSTLYPPPLFDAAKMESQKLQLKVLTGFGGTVLKRFCGKASSKLLCVVSRIREQCQDERISVKVDVDQNEITLFASSRDMEKATTFVKDSVEHEQRLMRNECLERCLYKGRGMPPVALFGAGAEIKHLELQKRFLTVDLLCSNAGSMDPIQEKELLMFIEMSCSGSICAFQKFTASGPETDEIQKFGRLTFVSPEAAQKAVELNQTESSGFKLKVIPSQPGFGGDLKMFSFPAVKAKVHWPRRRSKGFAVLICDAGDVELLLQDFSFLIIGGKLIRCERGNKSQDSVMIIGFDKDLSEAEIGRILRSKTSRTIRDLFIVRGDAVENPPVGDCAEALSKVIAPLMPKTTNNTSSCRVEVFPSEAKDAFTRATITFDGRLHLEAARALEKIDGLVLPGCQPWQKIMCQHSFHTSLTCSVPVYSVIKRQLDSLIQSFMHAKGVECNLERIFNGSYRVRITANATRTVADLRRRVEELMRGKTIDNESLTRGVLQHLFSPEGINLMRSLQRETSTHIFFDRHNLTVRVFGPPKNIAEAQQKLTNSLLSLHESKQLEIHLRGRSIPPNLMKQVVSSFGSDLRGLREKVPEADFTLNARRHVILMQGDKDLKPRVEEIIYQLPKTDGGACDESLDNEVTCSICLCDLEDPYQLEGCTHRFCRPCLLEQCDSAIRNQDSFPILCAHKDCGSPIWVADLRSLLSAEKIEELFRASLGSFVVSSGGVYRFCPSPDCPAVYRVAAGGEVFMCGACGVETCTSCHSESHPFVSCEKYREFKLDPDLSLKEWRREKVNVKNCPGCGYIIEKVDGCNHMECRCGRHICWVCLKTFSTGDLCYGHLRDVHSDPILLPFI